MNTRLNHLLRGLCLLTYAAALAHLAGLMPAGWLARAPLLASLLLAVHALEVLFVFKHLRLYRGPLWHSLLLTLLFGLLHWLPLVQLERQRAARQGGAG